VPEEVPARLRSAPGEIAASTHSQPEDRPADGRAHAVRPARPLASNQEKGKAMISDKMAEALNLQMNREFFNARLYLSMSAYFESLNLTGAAHWMQLQAQEETGHAMRLYHHLLERGARVVVSALEAPPADWDSPLAAFEAAYEHECKVSREFDEHLALAEAEKDNATVIFLQWFITEQVEEEASADAIVQKLKMIGDHKGGLFMLDRALGQRGGED
jgi:ferritin